MVAERDGRGVKLAEVLMQRLGQAHREREGSLDLARRTELKVRIEALAEVMAIAFGPGDGRPGIIGAVKLEQPKGQVLQ